MTAHSELDPGACDFVEHMRSLTPDEQQRVLDRLHEAAKADDDEFVGPLGISVIPDQDDNPLTLELQQRLERKYEAKAREEAWSIRNRLLEENARKPVREFRQLDVFTNVPPGDPIVYPDEDGDAIFGCRSYELRRNGDILRVQYPPEMPGPIIVRLLRKLATKVEEGFNAEPPDDDDFPWTTY